MCLYQALTLKMKCQACSINERINDESLHCGMCIMVMMNNHLKMLLEGTMNEKPHPEGI